MNRLLTTFLAAGLALSLGTGALAQPATAPAKKDAPKDAPKDQPKKDDKPATAPAAPNAPDPKEMEAMMEAIGKPGAQHDWLKGLEGSWTAKCSEMDMATGGMKTSDAESSNKMVYGGRYLECSFKGRMAGKFFYGTNILGYSNSEKKFQSVWYDSMNTSLSTMSGQLDSAGKVLTLTGEEINPEDGKKMKARGVFTMIAKDHFTFDYYMTPAGQPEMKWMTIDYTKGSAAKEEKKDEKEAKKEDKKSDKNDKYDKKSN